MDIHVDTADLTTYVKVPLIRTNRWSPVSLVGLIAVAAKRHQWRMEIAESLKWLNGDKDE